VWRCYAWQIGGFAVSKAVFRDFTITPRDVGSLALGGIACTMFPLSALAQSVFLGISETFFLYSIGASATDVGITAFMHSFGIAGNSE
jgi:hypothetical protein